MSAPLKFLIAAVSLLIAAAVTYPLSACCAVSKSGQPVLNADQTVVIIWDAAKKTQHFIRKASFKSQADDFGFLVPTPTQPELSESGNAAFAVLLRVTSPKPEPKVVVRTFGGFGGGTGGGGEPAVKVLENKLVAGFRAVVLETRSAQALVEWLREHDYAYSPEVEAWAEPYVSAGWKITALKIAVEGKPAAGTRHVATPALRISFATDTPLFPYREPNPANASALKAKDRLLRIYFVAEERYRGELATDAKWSGKVAWANQIDAAEKAKVLKSLRLPAATGPQKWFLTEFEDNWPYAVAPADLTFVPDSDQSTVDRNGKWKVLRK